MKNKKIASQFFGFKIRIFILLINISFFGIFFLLPKTVALAYVDVQKLIYLTNEARLANFLSPFEVNEKLTVAAQNKCQDMIEKNYFAHTSPSGKPFWEWLKEVNYNYLYAGENLAIDFSDEKEVLKAWLVSPAHRANILNPKFKNFGVAAKEGKINGEKTIVIAQEFGLLAKEEITNEKGSLIIKNYSFILPTLANHQKVDFFFINEDQNKTSLIQINIPEKFFEWQVIFGIDKKNQLVQDKNYQQIFLTTQNFKNEKSVLGTNFSKTSFNIKKESSQSKKYSNKFLLLTTLLLGSLITNLLSLTTVLHLNNKSSKIPTANL